jgi:hypothetical protein
VIHKLDIFQKLGNGQLLWVRAVEGLEEAHAYLRHLTETRPGEYFIYDTNLRCMIVSPAAVPS